MKRSWAQPSLSRDFILLSAAIFFTLFLISAWVITITYGRNNARIAAELQQESAGIEQLLGEQMDSADYLLTAIGRQIVLNAEHDPVKIAELLKSFDNHGSIYSMFSWIAPDRRLIAGSNSGVLDQPVDLSDRDYVRKAQAEPWKLAIGTPIEGRVSKHWVIPVALGLTDYTGKFIGSVMVSIDIDVLAKRIGDIARREGLSFAIVSKSLLPLAASPGGNELIRRNFPEEKIRNVNFSAAPRGLIAQGNLLWGTDSYTYYRASDTYPYIIMLGYDGGFGDEPMRSLLWSRLLQLAAMAAFFFMFFWIIHQRLILPVEEISAVAARVARGETFTALPGGGPSEIRELATHIHRISDYIEEIRRIEDELRSKAFQLKKDKEQTEMDALGKADFLAYSCQRMRSALNTVIGCSQVMKDQLYGAIENRKYRQYAADIYQAGNQLLAVTQDLLTIGRAQTGALALTLKPVEIAEAAGAALRHTADRLQAAGCNVSVQLGDGLPSLLADEFRLQQMLSALLLYLLDRAAPESTLRLSAALHADDKGRHMLALALSVPELSDAPPDAQSDDIRLELARALAALHRCTLDMRYAAGGCLIGIALLFEEKSLQFPAEAGGPA